MEAMEPQRPEIVSEDRHLERLLAEAFGGVPDVYTAVHHTRKYEVPVLSVHRRPEPELSSLATLGLWRTPLVGLRKGESFRIELVGISETAREGCREVLASAAFRVMRTHQVILPGTVLLNCLHDWYPKASVPHLYFVEARRWSFPTLHPAKMGSLEVHFLEALPVTEEEAQHVASYGGQALEAKLLGASANLWDLRRESVV